MQYINISGSFFTINNTDSLLNRQRSFSDHIRQRHDHQCFYISNQFAFLAFVSLDSWKISDDLYSSEQAVPRGEIRLRTLVAAASIVPVSLVHKAWHGDAGTRKAGIEQREVGVVQPRNGNAGLLVPTSRKACTAASIPPLPGSLLSELKGDAPLARAARRAAESRHLQRPDPVRPVVVRHRTSQFPRQKIVDKIKDRKQNKMKRTDRLARKKVISGGPIYF